jgi:ferritin-like metal-binding protein YciE
VDTPIAEPRQLFLHQLRTMLWVELTLAEEVLPELYDHVHSSDLRWALERHLGETEGHVKNLRRVFTILREPAEPEPSPALLGLKKERDELLKAVDEERHDLVDLFHADVVARSEHLEIAAYNGLAHMANALGEREVALLLLENMGQEQFALEQAESATARLLAERVESTSASSQRRGG